MACAVAWCGLQPGTAFGEEPAAEDAPAEDAPAEDVPAEDVPAEDVPAENASEEGRPVEAPQIIELQPAEDIASALDAFGAAAREAEGEQGDELIGLSDLTRMTDLVAPRQPEVIGWAQKTILRPRISWVNQLGPDGFEGSARLGGSVGSRWWQITERRSQGLGELSLSAMGAVGAERGWELETLAQGGAWIGPVSFLVGPVLRGGESDWVRSGDVALAWSLGPRISMGAHTRTLSPWVAVEPSWLLAGNRRSSGAPFSDTLDVSVGARIQRARLRHLLIRVDLDQTPIGQQIVLTAGLMLGPR